MNRDLISHCEFTPALGNLYMQSNSTKQYQTVYAFYDLPTAISPGNLTRTTQVGWMWKGTYFIHDPSRNDELDWETIIGRIYCYKESYEKSLNQAMRDGVHVHSRSGLMTTWEHVSPGKIRVKAVYQSASSWITLDVSSQERLKGPGDFTLLRLQFDPFEGEVNFAKDLEKKLLAKNLRKIPQLCRRAILEFLYDMDADKCLQDVFAGGRVPDKILDEWTVEDVQHYCG